MLPRFFSTSAEHFPEVVHSVCSLLVSPEDCDEMNQRIAHDMYGWNDRLEVGLF
jgi:hypothetical protein